MAMEMEIKDGTYDIKIPQLLVSPCDLERHVGPGRDYVKVEGYFVGCHRVPVLSFAYAACGRRIVGGGRVADSDDGES